MDFTALPTVIGLIILLAATGLLKPLRNLTTNLGNDVDTINEVKSRLVKEWDADSAIAHAKKMNKVFSKAEELGEVKTYEDVMAKLKSASTQTRVEE